MNSRQVYLDIAGRMHSLYRNLIDYPPQGYRFISGGTGWDSASSSISRISSIYSFQQKVLGRLFPINLAKAYIEKSKRPPRGTALTYSAGHIVFRQEPWVVDLECVTQLAGGSISHLKRYSGLIQQALASEHCKKVICWTETEKKTFLANLDCRGFEDKLTAVYLAIPPQSFEKIKKDRIKLLFISSLNMRGSFDLKGGKEVLEAFARLRKQYDNIELTIRSDVSPEIKARCEDLPGLKLIDRIIPREELENEFKTADIFLFPAHTTPGLAILEAMSYELPVITTDVRANAELVTDGRTGFLVSGSPHVPYYAEGYIPQWGTPQFDRAIRKTDPAIVDELVAKTVTLIENPDLRRQMGKAGREQVEKGKFSVEQRNKKLKDIFDEAIQG